MSRRIYGRISVFLGLSASVLWLASMGGCPQNGGGNNDGNQPADNNTPVDNNTPPVAARLKTPSRSTNIALTSDDRRLVVANHETNTVAVIEVRSANGGDVGNRLAEIAVGQEPYGVAISPDDKEAYVCNTVNGTVTVISLSGANAFTVLANIAVGSEPRGCALTPNGTRLFVANHTSGTVSVIDPKARQVVGAVNVGGNPFGVAVTNDGDSEDNDETVFVTEFYGEVIPGGKGEMFDTGKQGVVNSFSVGNLAAAPTRITLAPLTDSGFTADRNKFCKQLNAAAVNDTFCPDTTIASAADPKIAANPQGCFPNQLSNILIRGSRGYIPNIAAAPEPPIKFNVNVQALVSVIDAGGKTEVKTETLNLNAQIKAETQPADAVANTVLTRLFGGDTIAVDADADGKNFVFLSRGGNYVMRAALDSGGKLSIGAPNVVRLQTGNIPTGLCVSSDGKRCYTNNEVNVSVSALNLENNTVLARDIPAGDAPDPGTFEHDVLVGKLVFFTALGVADDGIFQQAVREIVPLTFRNKASDNSWSSCASCHPGGLSDRVTWCFATGPRQTVALDGFFAKDNPHDQRISNWNAVRGSVNDFNENSVVVQGGKGFAGTPPKPEIYNHGITQGASDALDAQTLWVQTVRPPVLPGPTDVAAAGRGRELFGTNCASCHGGPKWTKSTIIWLDNPTFAAPPVAGSVARDPGIANTAAQIRSYTVAGVTINFLENVGTFSAASPIEIRNDATGALGGLGFNVPALLGIAYHKPYFHDGSAVNFDDVWKKHKLGAGTIDTVLNAAQLADLTAFVSSIDGATVPFRSDVDTFRDNISP